MESAVLAAHLMMGSRLALVLLIGLVLGGLPGCRSDYAGPLLKPRSLSGGIVLPHLPAEPPPGPPADARLCREGRTTVRGHVLSLPPDFSAPTGDYDLVIHFHGNTDAVEESYRRAGVNAPLVIVNLGAGATRYVRRFADPSRLPGILRRVDEKLAARGLKHPHRRRLALSAWSAGYGAVMRILEHRELAAQVDAVLLLDGLHARRMPVTGGIDRQDLAPFAAFAARAAIDDALFVITHSDIEPEGPLVSVDDCSGFLLRKLRIERRPMSGRIAPTTLAAAHAAYATRSLLPLELSSVARHGGLVVRAFEGRSPEHHIAHLFQMEELALHDLEHRWSDHGPTA